jgi:hypothetical protein
VFGLEEANALIPQLESLLQELDGKYELFQRFQDELLFEELLEEYSPPETKLHEMEGILGELEEEIEKIQRLGCLLRHPERGLVDFLARRGEEWVYYCWRPGEKEIQFYHPIRGGLFNRQPLR